MNSEVDVNILVNLYNQKISTLTNQNILLEAKNQLLTENLNLQNKYDELKNSRKLEK